MPRLAATPSLLALAAATGCVQRTVSITTDPPGALVWLNDREIGRTPLEVGFDYYGTYDVRLEREGYEPVMTSGRANAPWWDTVGLDLVSELIPADLHSRVAWHYVLEPLDDDPDALVERARNLRARLAAPGGSDATATPGTPAAPGKPD